MRLSAFILILQSATLGALYLLVHGTLSKSLNLRLSMKLKMASMGRMVARLWMSTRLKSLKIHLKHQFLIVSAI